MIRVNNLQDRFDPDWSPQSFDLLAYAHDFLISSNSIPLQSINLETKEEKEDSDTFPQHKPKEGRDPDFIYLDQLPKLLDSLKHQNDKPKETHKNYSKTESDQDILN